MINVSDSASGELKKILANDLHADKNLVIFFQGFG
jgi:hypothetical protein